MYTNTKEFENLKIVYELCSHKYMIDNPCVTNVLYNIATFNIHVRVYTSDIYKDYLKLCRLYGVEAPAIDDEELDENGEVKQSK